jgi:hypothetical protein
MWWLSNGAGGQQILNATLTDPGALAQPLLGDETLTGWLQAIMHPAQQLT